MPRPLYDAPGHAPGAGPGAGHPWDGDGPQVMPGPDLQSGAPELTPEHPALDLDTALEVAFGAEAAAEFLEVDASAGPGGFDDPETLGQDESEDEQIVGYLARAASSGREHLSALSALSQQMSQYPTLSPTEQSDRLRAYHDGVAAQAELDSAGAQGRTLRPVQMRVSRGRAAQTELVASMFRLVLIIAREIAEDRYGRAKALEILPDLVAEANLALVESVATYDPAKCPTFSIYAGRVIRDRVRMSLQKASSPVGVAPSWIRLKRIYTVLRPEVEMRLGRTPTEEEMQAELRIVCLRWASDKLTEEQRLLPEGEQHQLMESKLRKQGMLGAIDRLQEVLAATHQVGSLDSPLGEDGGSTLGDLLPDRAQSGDFDPVEHAELRRDLMQALASLTEREQQIILHRFGFIDGEAWTYARLAPLYSVSAERIRQIERNVLGKLRSPAFSGLDTHLPSHREADPDADAALTGAAGRRRRFGRA